MGAHKSQPARNLTRSQKNKKQQTRPLQDTKHMVRLLLPCRAIYEKGRPYKVQTPSRGTPHSEPLTSYELHPFPRGLKHNNPHKTCYHRTPLFNRPASRRVEPAVSGRRQPSNPIPPRAAAGSTCGPPTMEVAAGGAGRGMEAAEPRIE